MIIDVITEIFAVVRRFRDNGKEFSSEIDSIVLRKIFRIFLQYYQSLSTFKLDTAWMELFSSLSLLYSRD